MRLAKNNTYLKDLVYDFKLSIIATPTNIMLAVRLNKIITGWQVYILEPLKKSKINESGQEGSVVTVNYSTR